VSVVRHIPYVNRLAKAISVPGGKRLSEALDDAEANLKTIEMPCLEAVDAYIASIQKLSAQPSDPAALEQIYDDANRVVGMAGVFGLGDLGRAAYCLCELVDSRPEGAGVDPVAMGVHVESLRILRQGEALPAVQREAMVEGLLAVVARAKRAATVSA
jgi:hypothetical protein